MIKQKLTGVGIAPIQALNIAGVATTSLTAAGTTTTDALVLGLDDHHIVGTVGANSGVRLPSTVWSTGDWLIVSNTQATNTLKLYPPTGGTINGGAADAALSVPVNRAVMIICTSATAFQGIIAA